MLKENDNQLLSVTEFAELSGVKASTLRYFDDLGLFEPAYRKESGYRYYTLQQLITINFIIALSEINVPVKTMTEVAQDRTPEKVFEFITEKEIALESEMASLRRSLNIVKVLRRIMNRGLHVDETKISVEYLTEMTISIGPANDFSGSEGSFYMPFLEYTNYARERNINLCYPIGGLFTDYETFLRNPNTPANFFSVDPDGINRREAGLFLTGFARGYYGSLKDLPERMAAYAKENNLTLSGPVYNIFLFDEISEANPDNYLVEVGIPVIKTQS
ncbi:MAG: MerR family DNA-binding transcriptional regulator [Clostridiales Family XIII bacterium]|jgi:DNA-binding transcriptional MerR regulator|nr:MerR family DNA-binding transcriptional regulator [Clostridiales Family XIII bacterium]